jgi:thiol-disulfide isomerase/thioredoxin
MRRFKVLMMRSRYICWVVALAMILLCSPVRADDFQVTDLNGKLHMLAAYRGKWVLVNFWATWCPPCLEEVPELISLQESHKDMMLIGVAMDYKSRKEILDFADDNLMSYPLVLGDELTMRQFGSVEVLPSTYIYNPQGKLVKRYRGSISRKVVEKLMQSSP